MATFIQQRVFVQWHVLWSTCHILGLPALAYGSPCHSDSEYTALPIELTGLTLNVNVFDRQMQRNAF